MGSKLSDGIVDVHGISPIVQAQKRAVVEPHRAYGFDDSGKSRIPISVLLSKDRYLLRRHPSYFHQVANDGVGFLGVACPVVEDVAVRRVAPGQGGACEGSLRPSPA
jgi:hypothetical protein